MATEEKTESGFENFSLSARRRLNLAEKVKSLPVDDAPQPAEDVETPRAAARVVPLTERDPEGRVLTRTNLRFPKAYSDALKLLTVKRKRREHVYELVSLAVGEFIRKQVESGVITQQELDDIQSNSEDKVANG